MKAVMDESLDHNETTERNILQNEIGKWF